MFRPIQSQTSFVSGERFSVQISTDYPSLAEAVAQAEDFALWSLAHTITYAMPRIFAPAIAQIQKLSAQLGAQGHVFHPVLLPTPTTSVSLPEAYLHNPAFATSLAAAYLAAQSGLTGCGIVSGTLAMRPPGHGRVGHTVALLPPSSISPHGMLYEAFASPQSRYGFRSIITQLGQGDTAALVANRKFHEVTLAESGQKFRAFGQP